MSALWLFRWVVTGTAALLAADVILNGLTSNSHHSMILGGFTARWHLAQHARLGFLILTVALAVAQVALVWLTQLGKRRSVAIASEVVLWLSLGLAVHWSVPVATSCIQLGPPPESCFSETVGFPSAGWITISVMIGVVIGLVWSICSSHQEEVDDRSVPVEAA